MTASIYLLSLFICTVIAALDPNWRLAWNDEFNFLDSTKWNVRDRSGNYGNGEMQWYSPMAVNVTNGNLYINAWKQSYGGESYVAGWLDSMDKGYFTYGRYEVRAKFPAGKGYWPAIWLLSQSKCWAYGSELDIAEFRGIYKNAMGMYYHYASTCCASYSSCVMSKGQATDTTKSGPLVDFTSGYHVIAAEWSTTNTTWYVDGVPKLYYTSNSLSVTEDASPHYWILNFAVGGGYPTNPDSTTPANGTVAIDYIRNYVYRKSCSGVTCSGHGCCNSTSVLCVCNSGWAGANCEAWVGSIQNDFNTITNMENIPNGWGNPYTLYLTQNSVSTSGTLKLTLTNAGCPGSCGNAPYSSGAWESIPRYTYGLFTYIAQGPSTPGTGFSCQAAGPNYNSLEQWAYVFTGGNRSYVALWSWTNNWGYKHADIFLGFDHSAAFHSYSVLWGPTSMTWYIDNKPVFTHTDVIPQGPLLGPGVYYSAEPDWYGALSYSGPASTYIDQFVWNITQSYKATC